MRDCHVHPFGGRAGPHWARGPHSRDWPCSRRTFCGLSVLPVLSAAKNRGRKGGNNTMQFGEAMPARKLGTISAWVIWFWDCIAKRQSGRRRKKKKIKKRRAGGSCEKGTAIWSEYQNRFAGKRPARGRSRFINFGCSTDFKGKPPITVNNTPRLRQVFGDKALRGPSRIWVARRFSFRMAGRGNRKKSTSLPDGGKGRKEEGKIGQGWV